jgi:hypothetical protein
MASTGSPNQKVEFNTTMWAGGAVLALVGSMLVGIGMLLGGMAVLSAARQWIQQLETPPTETARSVFRQLQSAASAGAKAWQGGPLPSGGAEAGE